MVQLPVVSPLERKLREEAKKRQQLSPPPPVRAPQAVPQSFQAPQAQPTQQGGGFLEGLGNLVQGIGTGIGLASPPGFKESASDVLKAAEIPARVSAEGAIGFLDPRNAIPLSGGTTTGEQRVQRETQRFREETGRNPSFLEGLAVSERAQPLPPGVRGAAQLLFDPLNASPGLGVLPGGREIAGAAGRQIARGADKFVGAGRVVEEIAEQVPAAARVIPSAPRQGRSDDRNLLTAIQSFIKQPRIPVFRIDKPGLDIAQLNKPQGLYVSIGVDAGTSPHLEEGSVLYRLTIEPKSVLRTPDDLEVSHVRFGRGGKGPASAGVAALQKLLPNDFSRLLVASKADLVEELNHRFSGPDYNQFADAYELLEVYAAQVARRRGFDAIESIDTIAPQFSEIVVLDNTIISTTRPSPVPRAGAISAPTRRTVNLDKANVDPSTLAPGTNVTWRGVRGPVNRQVAENGQIVRRPFTGPQPGVPNVARVAEGRPIVRGKAALISRLGLEERLGGLSPEAAESARAFLRMLPDDLLQDLGSTFYREAPDVGGVLGITDNAIGGFYDSGNSLVNIVKGVVNRSAAAERIIVHEISHHLEQFIPSGDARKLVKQFEADRAANGDQVIRQANTARAHRKQGPIPAADENAIHAAYRFEGTFPEWLAEVLTDKALRDIFVEIPTYRNAFQKVMARLRDIAIETYNFIRGRRFNDEAERVYRSLINGEFPASGRRTLGIEDALLHQGPTEPSVSVLAKVDTMRSVAPKTTPAAERVEDLSRTIQENLTDKFAGANAMDRRAKREFHDANPGEPFPQVAQVEQYLALAAGSPESAKTMLDHTAVLLGRAMGRNTDVADVNRFFILKHIGEVINMHPERLGTGGINSVAEADQGIQELATKLGPERMAQVEQASAVVREHFRELLDMQVASGLIESDLAQTLKTQYPWYYPLKYVEDEIAGAVDTGRRTVNVADNGLRRLSEIGNEAASKDPLDTIARTTVQVHRLIAHNDAKKAAIYAAQLDPKMADQITFVPPAAKGVIIEGEAAIRKVPQTGKRGTIAFHEGGDVRVYEVPNWLVQELEWVNHLPSGIIDSGFRILNTIPRAVLTSYNPAFIAGNFVYDMFTVGVTRGVGPHRVIESLLRNVRAIVRDDPNYRAMLRAGVGMSGFHGQTPEQIATSVRKSGNLAVRTQDDWRKLLANPIKTINVIGRAVEMAPRRAMFEQTLRKGGTTTEAALDARRVTVDFQRNGRWVREANNMWIYLNAAVQGALLPFRALRDFQAARYGLAGFMAAQIPLYAYNRTFTEERGVGNYNDIPLRERTGKIIIMIPSSERDQRGNIVPHYITPITNLREFSLVAAPIIYLMAKLDERDPESLGQYLQATAPSVNPASAITGGGESLGGIQVPGYPLQKIAEIAANHDSFRDREIVPIELEGLPLEQQFTPFTSEVAKRIGPVLGISPLHVDHMMKAGVAADMFALADVAIRRSGGGPDPYIDGLAAQLEEIEDNYSAEEVKKIRRRFLADLPAGDDRKVLDRELSRRQEARLPFVSRITDRFYRKRGGQLYRTAVEQAVDKAGVSKKQTRQASGSISRLYDVHQSAEKTLDVKMREGEITPAQWRQGHSVTGRTYGAQLAGIAALYPGSLQATSPLEREQFNQMVNTMMGAMPDKRSRAELMIAAYRTIQPEELAPGIMDFRRFYAERDKFVATLSSDNRVLFQEERELSMTATEKEWEAAQRLLKPYWDVGNTIPELPQFPVPQSSKDRWEEYLLADAQKRQFMLKETPEMAEVFSLISEERQAMRHDLANDELDFALTFWGYRGEPSHPRAVQLWKERNQTIPSSAP